VIWTFIIAGIALAGLLMVVSYAVWLIHKASDVMGEVRMLLGHGGQLVALVGEIQVPQFAGFEEVDNAHTAQSGHVTGPTTRMSTS
jgi:hypothetical protein